MGVAFGCEAYDDDNNLDLYADAPIQLDIHWLTGKSVGKVSAHPSWRTQTLKDHIETATGIPAREQSLVIQDLKLRDDDLLVNAIGSLGAFLPHGPDLRSEDEKRLFGRIILILGICDEIDELTKRLTVEETCSRAAQVLSAMGYTFAKPALQSMYEVLGSDFDDQARITCALALVKLGELSHVVRVLQGHLEDKMDGRRTTAAKIVHACAQRGLFDKESSEKIGQSLVLCLDDEDADVRFGVALAIGELGVAAARPAVASLQHLLEDADHGVQQAVARALIKLGVASDRALNLLTTAASVQPLQQAKPLSFCQLGQRDSKHLGAMEMLGSLRALAAPAVPTLRELLLHSKDRNGRRAAAVALGRIGAASGSAVDALVQAFGTDEDWGVRNGSAWALGEIGAPGARSAIATLRRALKGRLGADEEILREALRKIGPPIK